MKNSILQQDKSNNKLLKSPTGIDGLDDVLMGGLPLGRPSLICGSAGCGKTLLACEYLVHGVEKFDEPGVFMAFEETAEELSQNLASLGIDLQDLINQGKIFVDYLHIDRSEIEETGEYDLEGLFIRLAGAIDAVGAKRVVLDTLETLFVGFSNETILRSELQRIFRWLKARGVTAVVTGERGEKTLTRHGLEEYVSDCVILLDHTVKDGVATRLLRVVKYRGSSHGNNEYPFLIDDNGIWLLPLTSAGLDYPVSRDFISTGIPDLDGMLDNKGIYRGASILISGTAGTGKTSLAAHMVDEVCRSGEKCLYFAYEESSDQILRNMTSIGLDLAQWVDQGLLRFHAQRPSFYSAEMHLLTMEKLTSEFQPTMIVIDPISNLSQVATPVEVKSLLVRIIDFFKMSGITALFTSLTHKSEDEESSLVGVSSLMDTWILLRDIETNGERNRAIHILKSRGMNHSNQVREFLITDDGIKFVDIYFGPDSILTGSARAAQIISERVERKVRRREIERKRLQLERKRLALEARVAELQDIFTSEEEELRSLIEEEVFFGKLDDDMKRRGLSTLFNNSDEKELIQDREDENE